MQTFVPIPTEGLAPQNLLRAMRTNCQGSLFQFIKVALKRKRLTPAFHLRICRRLETDHLKLVFEMPRDHFKSTIAGEGLPMWNALPFTLADELHFRSLGYNDEFIRWMKRSHDPCTRILLVSESVTNAAKLGSKIRRHYESNDIYRTLFPETLPDTSCVWTNFSLHVKRPADADPHGEGTFDFIGVGGALQSRHYKKIIQDDLVGRKAIESPSIMEKTIEYHQLVAGAFDQEDAVQENDELVIGNRWSFHDLNSHLREYEPWFDFESHSALGGCCEFHPADQPIFPEDFSAEKLFKLRQRLGSYMFSCQFLNNPAAPENSEFKQEWLNYYSLDYDKDTGVRTIRHHVSDGIVRKDIDLRNLRLAMVVDPAHATNSTEGRCRHAIIVIGVSSENQIYLLEAIAMQGNHPAFFDKMFLVAQKWGIHKVGFEAIAAQKFAITHILHLNRSKPWRIDVPESHQLKGEVESPDGTISRKKEWRIRNVLGPMFEFGRFWMMRGPNGVIHQDFLAEYTTFPRGRYVDQLDALAYAPQLVKNAPMSGSRHYELLARNRELMRQVTKPYSLVVH